MNKHIQTIVSFRDGVKQIIPDQCSKFCDAGIDLLKALKRMVLAIVCLLWLLFPLVIMIFCLPLATWIRLKAERDYEKAVEKAKREYMELMTCLHHKERSHDD